MDANVGVVRQLSLEPKIKSGRGFIELSDNDISKLKDVNVLSPAELLTPIGATTDDNIRTSIRFCRII